MKRSKLFILAAIASLTLVGCGDSATQVDLKTEAGATALKASAKTVAEAYSAKIDAIGFKGELKDSSVSITGEFGGDGFAAKNLNIGLTGLAGKVEGGLKKAASESEKPTAAINLNASGKLGVKGDFYGEDTTAPMFSLDESLTAKNVGADFYSVNEKSYLDYSGAGLRQLFTDAGPVADRVIEKLTGEKPETATDVNALIDTLTGVESRKISFDAAFNFNGIELGYTYNDETAKAIDDAIDSYVLKNDAIRDVITFTTYSSGKFDVKIDLTLAKITTLLNTVASSLDEESQAYTIVNMVVALLPQIVTKCDLSLTLSFSKAGLLTNENMTLDLELNTKAVSSYIALLPMLVPQLEFLSSIKNLDVTIAVKLNESIAISYNDDVKFNLPSDAELAKFVPVGNGNAE